MTRSAAFLLVCAAMTACGTFRSVPKDARNLLMPVGQADYNEGFLKNPHWKCQETDCYRGKGNPPDANAICNHSSTKVPPQCSEKVLDIETPGWWTCYFLPGKLHGHINLAFSEFSGRAAWSNRNPDFDYEFELTPMNGEALTAASPGIALEFSSLETFLPADHLTPWWSEFREWSTQNPNDPLATEANNAKLRARFAPTADGRPNIAVVGLLGIDCEHECHSELHPVYAIAVRANDPMAPPNTETWMLFARNWGNEGSCSHNAHPLRKERRSLKVVIPNSAATGFTTSEETFRRSTGSSATASMSLVEGEGALVTFNDLSDPDDQDFIEGSVKVTWQVPGLPKTAAYMAVTVPKLDEWSDSEFARFLDQLSPEKRRETINEITTAVEGKRTTEAMPFRSAGPLRIETNPSAMLMEPLSLELAPEGVGASNGISAATLMLPAEVLRKNLCAEKGVARGTNGENLCEPPLPAPKP